MNSTVLVTGGAGFIGSALVRHLVTSTDYEVVNVDKLTYAGNRASVASVADDPDYHFEQVDITDQQALNRIFEEYQPEGVFHLAAESHVDRSIDGPSAFVQTNVVGTSRLLESSLEYWNELSDDERERFRFLHVSTDEVFGELGNDGAFDEQTAYDPSSPYSATKASADHLVRAWHETYDFPVVVTNCSNNYGPYQFPEKLIPVVILKARSGDAIPVYGTGENVRDWLYVDDHVRGLVDVFEKGELGETYCLGGNCEKQNIEVVHTICDVLDEVLDDPAVDEHRSLIEFVEDRPGHDFRYAIDTSKIEREVGWQPTVDFTDGIRRTVDWYLDHLDWCRGALGDDYDLGRLGLDT